jgi:hypothetical protein
MIFAPDPFASTAIAQCAGANKIRRAVRLLLTSEIRCLLDWHYLREEMT